jgi:hypothetical protein
VSFAQLSREVFLNIFGVFQKGDIAIPTTAYLNLSMKRLVKLTIPGDAVNPYVYTFTWQCLFSPTCSVIAKLVLAEPFFDKREGNVSQNNGNP